MAALFAVVLTLATLILAPLNRTAFLLCAAMEPEKESLVAADKKDSGAGEAPLLLGWREFAVNCSRGEFVVNGHKVLIEEVPNSHLGTGHVVWDGSLVLAKYIEHELKEKVHGSTVIELGAGTGVVGISCSALGAGKTYVTDLEYCLGNIEMNIERNGEFTKGNVEAFELDWFNVPSDDERLQQLDFIFAADVIWTMDLVEPFVETLKTLASRNPPLKGIYFAHQTRALKTDSLLFLALGDAGFSIEEIDTSRMHPDFVSQRIKLFSFALHQCEDFVPETL